MQVFQNHIALSILLLLLPLFSAVLSLFVSKKLLKITVPAVLGVTVLTGIYFFFSTWGMEPEEFSVQWFSVSSQFSFEAGILIDKYTSIMILIVTSISFLVHLYSLGYMAEDAGIKKYFGFLGLFTFTMLGIVLVNNLFLLFIFWELVGFTSYLLIGFWYEKDSASKASKKAFLVNKIGDAGYLVGLMIVFASFGTFTFTGLEDLVNSSAAQTGLVTWAGLCFFMGTMAKSAQFPLYVWLPDAMEGPTPVSAMIHAATMVAAGVFLLARLEFLLTPDALSVIAVFGAITALLGGYSAINQRDIKKILAFSTISQLGYMVMGIGVGGSSTGMFHLFTHAVFKAGLFLSAGAIIHAMHEAIHKSGSHSDPQDIFGMGALKNKMPLTFYTTLILCLALAGIPLTSGFMSKELIITQAFDWAFGHEAQGWYAIVPLMGVVAVGFTSYYVTRYVYLIFIASPAKDNPNFEHVKESPKILTIPVLLLTIFSLWMFYGINPFNPGASWFIHEAAGHSSGHGEAPVSHLLITVISLSVILVGALLWYFVKRKQELIDRGEEKKNWLGSLAWNSWYLDSIYSRYVVTSAVHVAKFANAIDLRIIDPILHFITLSQVVTAKISALFDRWVIDGFVHLFAFISSRLGGMVNNIQSGKVQLQIVTALFLMISVTLIIWKTIL